MAKIILESWREGFEKVSLTKLQIEMLGMSLKESKANVDALLNDNLVTIEIVDSDLARHFSEKIKTIGVNFKIEV
jgi:hypothetical protein